MARFHRIFGGGSRREPQVECVIDFMLNDSPSAMAQLLVRLMPIVTGSPGGWHLDLRRCRYLGPDAAVLILATALEAKRLGQDVRVSLPSDPPKIAAFCRFSGLVYHLTGSDAADTDHPKSETVPLQILHGARFQDADPVIRLVRRHIDIDRDTEDYLRVCINEVIQNVEDHAKSQVGAVVCARYMTQRQEVRVAIADRGLGVYETLRAKHSDTRNSQHALERIISGGYSAMSRINNMGLGISNLCSIVDRMRGDFCVVSGDAMVSHRRGVEHRPSHGVFNYPGTVFFFQLPVASD